MSPDRPTRNALPPPARNVGLALALALALVLAATPLAAQTLVSDQLQGVRFRYIGSVGNRVASIAGVPGDRTTYFAGAASASAAVARRTTTMGTSLDRE